MPDDLLFYEFDLRAALEHREMEMLQKIDTYAADRLLNTSPHDLAEYFAKAHEIPPVKLDESGIHADQSEVRVDVSGDHNRAIWDRSRPFYIAGTKVALYVPFEGEADLFGAKPSRFTLSPPRGRVSGQMLSLSTTVTSHDAASVKRDLERELENVRQYLGWIGEQVRPFNESLVAKARQRIDLRRDKLLKDRELASALGFPLIPRSESGTYAPPEVKRKAAPKPPPASSAPYRPEPALSNEHYEHVLEVINRTAVMLERSPATFAGMGEEQLRDQFLVPLNSHYQGQATGETFNSAGKTDILVRAADRPVFIAECKIWRGPKSLSAAVDQVLSYTTWRDTKAAVLVFNRNKNLSEVLSAVPGILSSHEQFKRALAYPSETGFRAVLSHPSDPNREVLLTVLVYDVPRKA